MKLRDYQKYCIESIVRDLVAHDAVYIKLATGAGKTFITVSLLEILSKSHPNLKSIFVVPKNVLIEQSERAFSDTVGVYNAGAKRYELDRKITIASFQSLIRSKNIPFCNLLIFDECHRAKATHKKLLDKLRALNPKIKLLGLTATDSDIDRELFPHKTYSISAKELTRLGYLAPIVTSEGRGKIDLSDVKIQGGEYNLKQLGEKFTDDKINEQVADMLELSRDRKKVIILTTSIAHAHSVFDRLPQDISSIIHSKQSKSANDAEMNRFKESGKFLVSVLIASEGFDFPPSDCLALMRPTRSPMLYEQAVGRIARLSEGKENGLFLDYGNVIENLGFFYDIRKAKKGEITFKECGECRASLPLSAKVCDRCGYIFTKKCKKCGKVSPIGMPCCRVEVDLNANTTERAYTKPDKWKEVSSMSVRPWKSKAGKICLRVDYNKDLFKTWASEYFGVWNRRDFIRWRDAHSFIRDINNPTELVELLNQGNTYIFNKPNFILIEKNSNGYPVVKSRIFGPKPIT